jgi:hypothetical protein
VSGAAFSEVFDSLPDAKGGMSVPILGRGCCNVSINNKMFAENSKFSCKCPFMFLVWQALCWRSRSVAVKRMCSRRSLAPLQFEDSLQPLEVLAITSKDKLSSLEQSLKFKLLYRKQKCM